MTDSGVDEIHLAGLALILFEGGDLLRVGRPGQYRPIAEPPAGVVGGVAVVLHAVGGQLFFGSGGQFADPEVPVTDECGERSEERRVGTGRRDRWGRTPSRKTGDSRGTSSDL